MSWPTGRFGVLRRIEVGCACVAVALLVGLIGSAQSGSAALPDEVTATAGSMVETVGGTQPPASTTTEVPDPPSTTTQSPPVEQAAPPPEETSTPARSTAVLPDVASGPDVASPSVGRIAEDPSQAIAAAAGASTESSSPPSASGGDGAGARPRLSPRQRSRTAGEEQAADGSEFAPIRWFLTYVWPAIALTADLRAPTPIARTVDNLPADNRQAAVPPVAQAPLRRGEDGQLSAAASLSRPPAPSPSPATSSWGSATSTGVRILIYLAMAALLAVFAFTIWRELPPASRWR
jgi:hypothetical protein